MRINTDKIRSENSLSDWLARYGIEIDKKGFAPCPFHNEKTASFKVYSDGTYHCFGCGAHGDVITFVMNIQNISFSEACKLLDKDITYSEQRRIDRIKRQREKQLLNHRKAVIDYWSIFDEWKLNEDVIKMFKPLNSEAEPNSIFFLALGRRSALEHALNVAESNRIKRGEIIG